MKLCRPAHLYLFAMESLEINDGNNSLLGGSARLGRACSWHTLSQASSELCLDSKNMLARYAPADRLSKSAVDIILEENLLFRVTNISWEQFCSLTPLFTFRDYWQNKRRKSRIVLRGRGINRCQCSKHT